MRLKLIALLLPVLALAGYKGHEAGVWNRWFGKQPAQISRAETESVLLAEMNERRELLGLGPLETDPDLDEWIAAEAAAIVPDEQSVRRFLKNLETRLPAVRVAKATYAESRDAVEVTNALQEWPDAATDSSLTHLSVHVFPKSNWNRFRVLAVAVKKLPRFDPKLLGIGHEDAEVYNVCAQCGHAHVTTVARSSLAVALRCDRCDQEYDIYAMRLDGSYLRVTELLRGYEGLAVFEPGMTKFQEMMAIWGAVRDGFRYANDMKGAGGHQDTWQTATETAAFRNGDCEDTSIFMADWLISRGIDARVAFGLVNPGEGHAWCVARVDGEEYLLESTAGGSDSTPPPQTTRTSQNYLPIAMFDRGHIYFRNSDGWTPRYWDKNEWRAVAYGRETGKSTPAVWPGELQIGARYFGKDRITGEHLAATAGAPPSPHP